MLKRKDSKLRLYTSRQVQRQELSTRHFGHRTGNGASLKPEGMHACRYEPEQLEGKEEALREDFRKVLKHKDFKLRLSATNLMQRQELYDKRLAAVVGKSAKRRQPAQQAA